MQTHIEPCEDCFYDELGVEECKWCKRRNEALARDSLREFVATLPEGPEKAMYLREYPEVFCIGAIDD